MEIAVWRLAAYEHGKAYSRMIMLYCLVAMAIEKT